MRKDQWKDQAACRDFQLEVFFDKYEEDVSIRSQMDEFCRECPVRKMCFATAVSNKEYGLWGGVYFEQGEISREFNKHKTRQDWADTWQALTMEQ